MKRGKRARLWTSIVLLCALLSACAGPAGEAPTSETQAGAETTAPTTQPTAPEPSPMAFQLETAMLTEENAPARAAYAAALKTLLDTNVLPDGTDYSDGYIGSISDRQRMAENQFAVCDVDDDYVEELVLLYTTGASMADMRGYIFQWSEETGELRTQFEGYPMFTFYLNGALREGWSHNQGKGGAFWPYNLYIWLPSEDRYQLAGAVDAWDKALYPEGYPDEADVSGTGFVYYITTQGDMTWDHPVDAAQHEQWLRDHLGDALDWTVSVPYQALTAENIQALQTPG